MQLTVFDIINYSEKLGDDWGIHQFRRQEALVHPKTGLKKVQLIFCMQMQWRQHLGA